MQELLLRVLASLKEGLHDELLQVLVAFDLDVGDLHEVRIGHDALLIEP